MKNSSSRHPKFRILVRWFIPDFFAALTLSGMPNKFFWCVWRFFDGLIFDLSKFFPCFGSGFRKSQSNFSQSWLVDFFSLGDFLVSSVDEANNDEDVVDVDFVDSVSLTFDDFKHLMSKHFLCSDWNWGPMGTGRLKITSVCRFVDRSWFQSYKKMIIFILLIFKMMPFGDLRLVLDHRRFSFR